MFVSDVTRRMTRMYKSNEELERRIHALEQQKNAGITIEEEVKLLKEFVYEQSQCAKKYEDLLKEKRGLRSRLASSHLPENVIIQRLRSLFKKTSSGLCRTFECMQGECYRRLIRC